MTNECVHSEFRWLNCDEHGRDCTEQVCVDCGEEFLGHA
jgi:hypothetical protein